MNHVPRLRPRDLKRKSTMKKNYINPTTETFLFSMAELMNDLQKSAYQFDNSQGIQPTTPISKRYV